MSLDPDLPKVGANHRYRGHLRGARERRGQKCGEVPLIVGIDDAVGDQVGEEDGLVARGFEMQSDTLDYAVDDPLAPVTHQFRRVQTSAFQRKDECGRGNDDNDRERSSQCQPDRQVARQPAEPPRLATCVSGVLAAFGTQGRVLGKPILRSTDRTF